MTATDIATQVHAGRRSALEVVTASLEGARGDDCQIFLSLNENALEEARRVDARVAAGESLPLAGVPVALKDNLCVAGLPATAGSRILEDYVSPYTGTAMQRLLDAGAVVIGKVNLDEFGMGSSGENSAFFPTLNPRDKTRVPGGSSSGSASSVAAGIVPIALGTDTGGSIRLPAAFTGCLGMKPTYGRVSRYGVIAFASSLDQVGPFAMSTADLAATLEVICGHDSHDATSLHAPADFSSALTRDVKGWRVGLVRDSFVGMAQILDFMASRNSSISQLVSELPQWGMIKDKMQLSSEKLKESIELLERSLHAKQVDTEDGVRLDWDD
ncbi:MAG: hypothetical protein HC933_11590, partial [Pleurocapsa sp. SU_196_0]|nr:hypothetical protein [Pleurocapsa sp. SU_196_0]